MKLRKLLAVTAVAATMTAAFAVNAMADTTKNLNSGADFTYEGGYITLTEAGKAKLQADGPYTMLVVATDGKGLDANTGLDTSFEDTDIKQIDQADAAFATINVGTLAEGTYEIRLGGDGQVRWGTLEVGADKPSYMLGDVTLDQTIDMGDAAAVLNHFMGDAVITDEVPKLAADVTLDQTIDMGDAAAILNHFMGDALIVQPE